MQSSDSHNGHTYVYDNTPPMSIYFSSSPNLDFFSSTQGLEILRQVLAFLLGHLTHHLLNGIATSQ